MIAFDGLLRETLIIAAVLCLPVLGAATLTGTLIAVLQAATQIQEQTLTLLPKMIIVGLALAAFGSFGMHLCANLFGDIITHIPELIVQ